jgi:FdhE protein
MNDTQPLTGSGGLGDIPYLRAPQPERLFARRGERFRALAAGHTLSEFLELLGRLAAAQAVAAARVRISTNGLELPRERPLDAANHRRGAEWREALTVILAELRDAPAPPETRAALDLLAALAPPELEALADRLLTNAVQGADLAAGPFAAAALQVYFTALASQIPTEVVTHQKDGCPVCGSPPVAGLVLGDDKLRYLVCSLCASQWHHTRVQCTACHEGKGIAYYRLERGRVASAPGPSSSEASSARAEACPACKAYTKLFYVEKDPSLEAFADDVATLALDLLMAEEGWARHGVNLFLVPGESPADAAG